MPGLVVRWLIAGALIYTAIHPALGWVADTLSTWSIP